MIARLSHKFAGSSVLTAVIAVVSLLTSLLPLFVLLLLLFCVAIARCS